MMSLSTIVFLLLTLNSFRLVLAQGDFGVEYDSSQDNTPEVLSDPEARPESESDPEIGPELQVIPLNVNPVLSDLNTDSSSGAPEVTTGEWAATNSSQPELNETIVVSGLDPEYTGTPAISDATTGQEGQTQPGGSTSDATGTAGQTPFVNENTGQLGVDQSVAGGSQIVTVPATGIQQAVVTSVNENFTMASPSSSETMISYDPNNPQQPIVNGPYQVIGAANETAVTDEEQGVVANLGTTSTISPVGDVQADAGIPQQPIVNGPYQVMVPANQSVVTGEEQGSVANFETTSTISSIGDVQVDDGSTSQDQGYFVPQQTSNGEVQTEVTSNSDGVQQVIGNSPDQVNATGVVSGQAVGISSTDAVISSGDDVTSQSSLASEEPGVDDVTTITSSSSPGTGSVSDDLDTASANDIWNSFFGGAKEETITDTNTQFENINGEQLLEVTTSKTGLIANQKEEDDPNMLISPSPKSITEFPETGTSHFIIFFIITCIVCVLGYVLFHNKKKILALVIEGRQAAKNRRGNEYKKIPIVNDNLSEIRSTVPLNQQLY